MPNVHLSGATANGTPPQQRAVDLTALPIRIPPPARFDSYGSDNIVVLESCYAEEDAATSELKEIGVALNVRYQTAIQSQFTTVDRLKALEDQIDDVKRGIARLEKHHAELGERIARLKTAALERTGQLKAEAAGLCADIQAWKARAPERDAASAALVEIYAAEQQLWQRQRQLVMKLRREQDRGNLVVVDADDELDAHRVVCLPRSDGIGNHYDGRCEIRGYSLPAGVRAYADDRR